MLKPNKLRWALAVLATLAAYSIAIQPACAKGGGHGGGGHGGGHAGGGHHGGGHAHAGGHGGEHHGGEHHGGEHHAGQHGDHHGDRNGNQNNHPYHPSQHHTSHHSHDHHGDHDHDHDHDHHHDHHHTAHHHHSSWHHGGWGPGFWGGAAAGYGLGYGYSNWDAARDWALAGDGGDTYVDNSTDVTPASNESDDSDDSSSDDNSADQYSDNSDSASPNGNSAPNGPAGRGGFPTDDWPELGVTTYAGQYGASQGQVIVRIVPASAAEKAGLVPGDVILSFNGKPVPSADDLDAAMDGANGKFEVVVWDARTGRQSTIDGNLDPAAPQTNETAAITPVQ